MAGPRRSGEDTSELPSHRDLHSFPTRRSSDLRRGPRLGRRTAQRDDRDREGGGEDHRRDEEWQAHADRERTRLNSRPTEIYTLSLHDALPIFAVALASAGERRSVTIVTAKAAARITAEMKNGRPT